MANVTRRISGKQGQIWLQNGSTAVGSDTTAGNGVAVTLDGITYDAYQVYTLQTAANIPMDPGTPPTTAPSGGTIPAAYTYDVNYLRGKIIYTPALSSGTTVSCTAFATPKVYPLSDTSDFNLDYKVEKLEAHAMMDTWKRPVLGFSEWSGSATLYYRTDVGTTGGSWWLGSGGGQSGGSTGPTQTGLVMRFYPAKGISTEYWYGIGIIDWGLKVPKGGMLEQAIGITGVGPLVWVTT